MIIHDLPIANIPKAREEGLCGRQVAFREALQSKGLAAMLEEKRAMQHIAGINKSGHFVSIDISGGITQEEEGQLKALDGEVGQMRQLWQKATIQDAPSNALKRHILAKAKLQGKVEEGKHFPQPALAFFTESTESALAAPSKVEKMVNSCVWLTWEATIELAKHLLVKTEAMKNTKVPIQYQEDMFNAIVAQETTPWWISGHMCNALF